MNNLPKYNRRQVGTLVSRMKEKPTRLICLTGPRQSGKTTLVLQALRLVERQSQYVAVDEPESVTRTPFASFGSIRLLDHDSTNAFDTPPDAQWLVRTWERARAEAKLAERGYIFVLDEIHRIPDWHSTVKGLWDADRRLGIPLHVVLLGSAPLLMHAGLSEALTGRFELIRLAHWSFPEMVAAFNVTLNEYVYFGGYPGAADLTGDEQRWRSYVLDAFVEPTLERDVLALERVDKPALLRQLFKIGAAYSGQIVAYTKLLGQLQDAGNTTTLTRYLKLLSQVGLLRGLAKFAANEIRRRASKPKLQVLNTALLTVHSAYTYDTALSDRTHWGRLVESAVGAHLCNTATADTEVYYWRESNLEVDYVVRHGHRVVGIEVKSGNKFGRLHGLQEFGRRFGATRLVTVGTGGMSLQELLQTPAFELFEDP